MRSCRPIAVWCVNYFNAYRWAHRAGAAWPCSHMSNVAGYADFSRGGDLEDVSDSWKEVDQNEFSACMADFVAARYGKDHPAVGRDANPVDWVKRA